MRIPQNEANSKEFGHVDLRTDQVGIERQNRVLGKAENQMAVV
jgi:hypothetical protein